MLAAKSTPRKKQKYRAGDRRDQSEKLRIAHADDHARINTYELNQETRHAAQYQKFANDNAGGERTADRAGASSPEIPTNQHADNEFINRRGISPAPAGPSPLHAASPSG